MSETMMNISSSPHVRDKWTTPYIMRVVLLSLLPATCVGIITYGWKAAVIVLLAVLSAVLTEWVFCKIMRKPSTIWDGSAAVTGLLLGLSLGPEAPFYLPVLGSVFAIAVVKCCFGGLGKNFINPALAGRCFLLISFANAMTIKPVIDTVSGATPMGALRAYQTVDITKMFLGTADGVIGSSVLALLIGGLVLWSMDIIHGQICFSVLGGFTLFIALFGGQGFDINFLLAHLCGGGVVMGAFFMATDYVTSPVSRLGQFIYGCLIGVLGGIFRLWGDTADSFSYAIIIGNVCTPLIDTYIVQKPLAYRKLGRTHQVRKEPWRIPKPVIALGVIAAIAGVALSGVFSLTKPTIDENEYNKKMAAFKSVCPGAETLETYQAADDLIAAQKEKKTPRIDEFYIGKDEAGDISGFAMSIQTKGFGGNMMMTLGLTPEGVINKITFTELNETAGLGMRADTDEFKDQFAGKKGTLELGDGDGQIDAITGATVTSNAVIKAVNYGLKFYKSIEKDVNKERIQKEREQTFRNAVSGTAALEKLQDAEDLIAAQDEKATTRINEFYVNKTTDDVIAGYSMSVQAKGFSSSVEIIIGITPEDGRIVLNQVDDSSETYFNPPYSLSREDSVDKLIAAINEAGSADSVDVNTGATFTSKAVVEAVNAGIAFCEQVTKGGN